MLKKITLRGVKLSYELERKSVKNLNLRVRSDGIHVSAPRAVPVSVVESFLRANADAVLRAVAHVEAKQPTAPERLSLHDGDTLSVFGEAVPVRVTQGTKNTASYRERTVFLTLTDPEDAALRCRLVDRLERELCEGAVTELCRRVYPYFAARGVPWPELKFRRMRSRWGSCTPDKHSLHFNTALACVPPACIEYVVVHEFCHFLQPNHSKAFHAEVEKLIPDHKARREALKGYEL